uniref:Uncharacterized protein n=1 Tax=Anguilla anguilla TaxID=7936 RepID=A0A0E9WDP8_ANGAN
MLRPLKCLSGYFWTKVACIKRSFRMFAEHTFLMHSIMVSARKSFCS